MQRWETNVIRSGDKLILEQNPQSGTVGGALISFADGTNSSAAVDQNSNPMGADPTVGWHNRTIDLSSFAGKTIANNGIAVVIDTSTAAGNWALSVNDIALGNNDGTANTIYARFQDASIAQSGTSGMTSLAAAFDRNFTTDDSRTTTYFHQDQVGSTRLLTTYYGSPVWQSTNLPFGYMYTWPRNVNDHVFGDLEFDPETENGSLEHAEARDLWPTAGRWLTPDAAGLAAVDPTNPQTWNRYAYVANNPTSATDPTGLEMCEGFCDEDGSGGFEPWNGGPPDGGGGFGGSGAGGGGGGAQLNACGVDPFCIQKGGIGPFGSPVANGGSWRDAQYLTGGNFLLHIPTADGSLVLNCAGSTSAADCAWDPFSVRYVLNGSQPHSINPVYPGLDPGDVPASEIAQGVLQGQRSLWQQGSMTTNRLAIATPFVPFIAAGAAQLIEIGPAVAQLSQELSFIQFASGLIQGVTPGPVAVSTIPEMAGAAVGEVMSNWSLIKQQLYNSTH